MAGAACADLGALNAFAEVMAGTGKPLVGTSGTLLLAMTNPGQVGTEEDAGASGFRVDAENLVIGLAQRDVRSSVIRLAQTVHSVIDRTGYIPSMIAIARRGGCRRLLRLPRSVRADGRPPSSARTREWLAWTPKHLGLIADMNEGHYFDAV